MANLRLKALIGRLVPASIGLLYNQEKLLIYLLSLLCFVKRSGAFSPSNITAWERQHLPTYLRPIRKSGKEGGTALWLVPHWLNPAELMQGLTLSTRNAFLLLFYAFSSNTLALEGHSGFGTTGSGSRLWAPLFFLSSDSPPVK